MKTHAIFFSDPVAYRPCLHMQERLVAARLAESIPDTVLFLEHRPVITLGVRGRPEHILLSREILRARNIDVAETSRGGDVTYHGPGQLVMYPILHLRDADADARRYVQRLEEVGIRTAAHFGVEAFRRKGMTGVWTAQGKLAAIGVRFKRWVSFHGISLNVAADLSGFDAIVPCGLAGEKVVSLARLAGRKSLTVPEVRKIMAVVFEEIFQRPLEIRAPGGDLPPPLAALLMGFA